MNFEKKIKQTISEAAKITLTKEEKKGIEKNILNFISNNNVRNLKDQRLSSSDGDLHFYPLTQNSMYYLFAKISATVVSFLIVATTGTAIAAEGSLPGDSLYKFKINVNENLQSAFALSDEAKVKYSFNLANKRLEEAETLSAEGRLNTDIEQYLLAQFTAHVNEGQNRMNKFGKGKENKKADMAADLESTLKSHVDIFAEVDRDDEHRPIQNELRLKVKESTEIKENANTEVKISPEVKAAAEGKMTAAQNKIDEVKKFYEANKSKLSDESKLKAETKINVAVSLISDGQVKLDNQKYAEAFVAFQQAHQSAQEAKIYVIGLLKVESDEEDENDDDEDENDDDEDENDDDEEEDENENDDEEPQDKNENKGRNDENRDNQGGRANIKVDLDL